METDRLYPDAWAGHTVDYSKRIKCSYVVIASPSPPVIARLPKATKAISDRLRVNSAKQSPMGSMDCGACSDPPMAERNLAPGLLRLRLATAPLLAMTPH